MATRAASFFRGMVGLGAGSLALLALMVSPLAAQSDSYLLQMPTVAISPGDSFALPVEGDWIEAVAGFQLSIAYASDAPIQNIDITVENSLVGALEPEFIQFNLSPGEIVGGVLFEVIVPFEGIVLPSVGFPLLIAEIIGDTAADVEEQLVPFTFVDGLGNPPINNSFVVGTASVQPDSMTNGAVDIRHPPGGPEVNFLRGDVNNDQMVDIADAIFHLNYTFGAGPLPVCLDAGDANDDGHSDISDGVFLLLYFFNDGAPLPPPFPIPGPDPTVDPIGCDQGYDE